MKLTGGLQGRGYALRKKRLLQSGEDLNPAENAGFFIARENKGKAPEPPVRGPFGPPVIGGRGRPIAMLHATRRRHIDLSHGPIPVRMRAPPGPSGRVLSSVSEEVVEQTAQIVVHFAPTIHLLCPAIVRLPVRRSISASSSVAIRRSTPL